MWGPQEEYRKLEPHDSKHENFLVLGPWRHGSWASSSRHLGNLNYGESIGKEYRSQIEAKFFGHYLKDATWLRPRRHSQLPDRLEHLEALLALPAEGSAANQPASCGRRPAQLERRQGTGKNELCKRSGKPGSLPSSPHPGHLQRWLAVVQLAHGRPALRHRSQRRRRLEAACAQEGPDRDRRSPGRHLRLDHRHRQRHGRQADRPVSRRRSRPEDARLPADDQRGDLPRPLSRKLRKTDPDARRLRPRVPLSACTT